MAKYRIPFNRPWLSGHEQAYITEALHGGHLSGDGPFTERCQRVLRRSFGHESTLLTTSCTDALEMTALLMKLQPGDEVIMPSFTFVSTANAFVLHGAQPIFVDIEPSTLNIDHRLIEERISDRTRAIVVVHYAGVGCDMAAIDSIARRHGLMVIEDNAHGLGGSLDGQPLGSFGHLATLSFHETKNFSCGEGGALIVNDESLLERAEIIREKGTDRSRFFRGQSDKYGWVDLGSSFLLSDLLAAPLLAQLEAKTTIQARRDRIWNRYMEGLLDWAVSSGVALPCVPPDRQQAFHMFYMIMPTSEARIALIARLARRGILAVFHYLPLHLSVMGRRLGGREGDCPITEGVCDRLVRLPYFTGLSSDDQCEVIDAVKAAD
ncbi:MAG TPA: dTDP-4-amino-4,6-dideoxygalactose transaminase [Acidimicrobiales bacterium]|nr:dTDP-4-amino-4,6-dideoxygalactose transaminase [Acidimicrobiales bacterium]